VVSHHLGSIVKSVNPIRLFISDPSRHVLGSHNFRSEVDTRIGITLQCDLLLRPRVERTGRGEASMKKKKDWIYSIMVDVLGKFFT
jgi:hypothetical protein